MDGIIIFDMGSDWLSRLASGAILVQAVAQYLVTLNIWSHNILLLLARRSAAKAGVPCNVSLSRFCDSSVLTMMHTQYPCWRRQERKPALECKYSASALISLYNKRRFTMAIVEKAQKLIVV